MGDDQKGINSGDWRHSHPENYHALRALIRHFHEAVRQGLAKVRIWGAGIPRRKPLFLDGIAAASLLARFNDFEGTLVTDPSNPDGTMRKLMDVSRLKDMDTRNNRSFGDVIGRGAA